MIAIRIASAEVRAVLRDRLPAALTLLLALGVAATLGHTYFGSGSSPYGMCEAANGQQVACAVLERAAR